MDTDRFVVISGCSSGGKSTLLAELARRGYATVEEPGQRIVSKELCGTGLALPWVDEIAFARRALALACTDHVSAHRLPGRVFFDRGLIDAATAVQHLTGEPALATFGHAYRYHHRVFLAPPWPEIYVTGPQRRHGFEAAAAEYQRLLTACSALGYEISILPKAGVRVRADFILGSLAA
jgi:predicted ATPase